MGTWQRIAALGAVATVLAAGAPAQAAVDADTTPPSVPQNVRTCGVLNGNDILCWDPSTDDSGSVYHYWVIVDGQQHARPMATTYPVDSLTRFNDPVQPGPHTITIQAVDHALNRSAPSAPLNIIVN